MLDSGIEIPPETRDAISWQDAIAVLEEIGRFENEFPLIRALSESILKANLREADEGIQSGLLVAEESARLGMAFYGGKRAVLKEGPFLFGTLKRFAEQRVKERPTDAG